MTAILLRNGRVLDPSQGLDGVQDVLLVNGAVGAIGRDLSAEPGTAVHDLAGLTVSPGWFDAHLHLYGHLGMQNADCVGVSAGATAVLDAGGSGPLTFEEFDSLVDGVNATDVYCYVAMLPWGLHYGVGQRGDVRDLKTFPVAEFVEQAKLHRDRIVGYKALGFGGWGVGPVQIAKGVARTADLPLYLHVGDFMVPPPEITTPRLFDYLESGDIATHCYTSSYGGYLDDEGRVYPTALAAKRRGVLFDVAMGGYNFAFDVAEKGIAQGLLPDILSSDIQNNNVTGPTFSLAHVMSIFLALGFSLSEVVAMVTIKPARALGLADRIGSLAPGRPADVTVFEVEQGDFSFHDCENQKRPGTQRIRPVMTFKHGRHVACDVAGGQRPENWRIKPALSEAPAGAASLTPEQRELLRALRPRLDAVAWDGSAITNLFRSTQAEVGLPLKPAIEAITTSLLEVPWPIQVGWLIGKFAREFVLRRFDQVAA